VGLSKFDLRESTDFESMEAVIAFLEFQDARGRRTIGPMNHSLASARAPDRTYLLVPGDRPERFDKAWDSAADAVILDLEDAVLPGRQDAARDAVGRWLRPERPVWVRCNATDSPWFEADLDLAAMPGGAGFIRPRNWLPDSCGRPRPMESA
jgi:citrate lyase subunit beta/citryl-CoA lyase